MTDDQLVKAGDVLLELDSGDIFEAQQKIKSKLAPVMAEITRLKTAVKMAEGGADLAGKPNYDVTADEVSETSQHALAAELEEYAAEMEKLTNAAERRSLLSERSEMSPDPRDKRLEDIDIRDLKLDISIMKSKFIKDHLLSLVAAETSAMQLAQELEELIRKQDALAVRAPIDGVVRKIVNSGIPSGVVHPYDALFKIDNF